MRLASLAQLDPDAKAAILRRGADDLAEVRPAVEAILQNVRAGGDAVLREYTEALDGVRLEAFAVEAPEMAAAARKLTPRLRTGLALMVEHLERVSRAQIPQELRVAVRPGLTVRRVFTPIDRVGIYVPGGKAGYPSSLLMAAIPARIAGCREIVVCSPPQPDGGLPPVLLAAAHLAGLTHVYSVGGAQAVAAMAFGTETIPAVHKIVGPGNRFVTAAKLAVYPFVEIDLPAGPSECLVIADASAEPEVIAAELLAQAEHGPDSTAILLTPSAELALRVQRLVDARAVRLARAPQIAQSLAQRGWLLVTGTLEEAVDFANAYASEHVQVTCADAGAVARRIRNAGSIFVGRHAPVPAGDYACGSNHILPTGGRARATSGVSVETYGKWVQVQELSANGLAALRPAIGAVAAAEGLSAHVAAVSARLNSAPRRASIPLPQVRQALERFAPYEWEPSTRALAQRFGLKPESVLRFDMNTLPMPPTAWAPVLRKVAGEAFHEYDDASYSSLTARIARYARVQPEQVTVGAGADELLDLCAKVFIDRGSAAIIPAPSYSMFGVVTAILDGQPVEVARRPDFGLDVATIVAAARAARVVFLCNPNNPTGTLSELDQIEAIAGQVPGAVVVDEAYYEFAQVSAVDLIARHPNVVVVRTFSKGFGLASARVGYAIAHPGVSARLSQVRPPTSVSRASVRLAEAALANLGAMRRRVRALERERAALASGLRGLGWRVVPSQANFLLVEVPQARAVAQELSRKGLVVRGFAQDSRLAGWLRITVRTRADDRRLLEALRRG